MWALCILLVLSPVSTMHVIQKLCTQHVVIQKLNTSCTPHHLIGSLQNPPNTKLQYGHLLVAHGADRSIIIDTVSHHEGSRQGRGTRRTDHR